MMRSLKDIAVGFCQSCSQDPSIFKLEFNGVSAGNVGGQTASAAAPTADRSFEF